MTTLEKWLAEAQTDIGYTECPRNSTGRCTFTGHGGAGANHTKYAAEAGLPNGVYWCAVRVSAIGRRCGLHIAGGPTTSTRALKGAAEKEGCWVRPADIQPGDIVLFHLTGRNGPGAPDHTGICVAVDHHTGTVTTVDGNTSFGPGGSEDNGGAVAKRTRPLTAALGASRPTFTAAPPASTEDDSMHVFTTDPAHDQAQILAVGGKLFIIPDGQDSQDLRDAGAKFVKLEAPLFDKMLEAAA